MGNLIKADSVGKVASWQVHLVSSPVEAGKGGKQAGGRQASPDEEARLLVEQARAEAEALVAQAQAQAEGIRDAAYQDGYRAATKELEAAQQAARKRASELEAEAAAQLAEFWKSVEPELLGLAMEIAAKIVRREMDENDAFIINVVKVGLQQLKERREIKIKVNPAHYAYTREHKDEITAGFDDVRTIDVIEDRRVSPGGCIIESVDGHLDARIETQLAKAEKALMEEWRDSEDSQAA